jgi:hypothetical protein
VERSRGSARRPDRVGSSTPLFVTVVAARIHPSVKEFVISAAARWATGSEAYIDCAIGGMFSERSAAISLGSEIVQFSKAAPMKSPLRQIRRHF